MVSSSDPSPVLFPLWGLVNPTSWLYSALTDVSHLGLATDFSKGGQFVAFTKLQCCLNVQMQRVCN